MAYADADALAAEIITIANNLGGAPTATVTGAFVKIMNAAANVAGANYATAVNGYTGQYAGGTFESALSVITDTAVQNGSEAGATLVANALSGAAGQSFDNLNDAISVFVPFVGQAGIGNAVANFQLQAFKDNVQAMAETADAIQGITGTITSGRISRLQLFDAQNVQVYDVPLSVPTLEAAFTYGTTSNTLSEITQIINLATALLNNTPPSSGAIGVTTII